MFEQKQSFLRKTTSFNHYHFFFFYIALDDLSTLVIIGSVTLDGHSIGD